MSSTSTATAVAAVGSNSVEQIPAPITALEEFIIPYKYYKECEERKRFRKFLPREKAILIVEQNNIDGVWFNDTFPLRPKDNNKFRVMSIGDLLTGCKLIDAHNVKEVELHIGNAFAVKFSASEAVDFKSTLLQDGKKGVIASVPTAGKCSLKGGIPIYILPYSDVTLHFVPIDSTVPTTATIECEYAMLSNRRRSQLAIHTGRFWLAGLLWYYVGGVAKPADNIEFKAPYKHYKECWTNPETDIPDAYKDLSVAPILTLEKNPDLHCVWFNCTRNLDPSNQNRVNVGRTAEFFTGFKVSDAHNAKTVDVQIGGKSIGTFPVSQFVDFKAALHNNAGGEAAVDGGTNIPKGITISPIQNVNGESLRIGYIIRGAIPITALYWHEVNINFVPIDPTIPTTANIEFEYAMIAERHRKEIISRPGNFVANGRTFVYKDGLVFEWA